MLTLIKKDIKSSFPKNLENETIEKKSFDNFKKSLVKMLTDISKKTENYNKLHITNFINETFYKNNYKVNNDLFNIDCTISSNSDNDNPIVLIETKALKSKEMINQSDANKQSLRQLILYYFRQLDKENQNIKHLIITDGFEWYCFNKDVFKLKLHNDSKLRKIYNENTNSLNEFLYSVINDYLGSPNTKIELECVYFNLENYSFIDDGIFTEPNQKKEIPETFLIDLYHFFSPENLVRKPFISDSNSLNKDFYNELLYILGLEEKKVDGKKVLERAEKKQDASLLELTIKELTEKEQISSIKEEKERNQKLFETALELCITWLNRILFLKLLESQLKSYHPKSDEYAFMNKAKIKNFGELQKLFFDVLAVKITDRSLNNKTKFDKVPYLNSSLFERTLLEYTFIQINQLAEEDFDIYKNSILQKSEYEYKKQSTLEYILNFLDSFDYSNISNEKVVEKKKTIINASVLGLIFEKINGYKDGSFFTPGYITMYMARESCRNAVVQKFNDSKTLKREAKDFEDLKDLIDYTLEEERDKANKILNTIRICDPAVGSGHFLVSVLNELIQIKYDLKVLTYKNLRKRIDKDWDILIENDELIVNDRDKKTPFKYEFQIIEDSNTNYINSENQELQETLFHEKQTLIENCLFGVDINSKSVQICQLRLWIELLKNAYYINAEVKNGLETLPNIDINIKCGNSLVSRFSINDENMNVQDKTNLNRYKDLVYMYKNEESRENRKEYKRVIEEIKSNFRGMLLPKSSKEKELINATAKLDNLLYQPRAFNESLSPKQIKEKEKLEAKISKLKEEENNEINSDVYKNAFEWRYEFPEVLDENGHFLGFDIIIGNPPYGVDLSKIEQEFYNRTYNIGSTDTAILFIKKSYEINNKNGNISFIIPKAFAFASNYAKIRNFVWENLKIMIDCKKVWKDVLLEQVIIVVSKENYINYKSGNTIGTNIFHTDIINKNDCKKFDLFLNGVSNIEIKIAEIIYTNSIFIKDIADNKRGIILNKFILNGNYSVVGCKEIDKYGIKSIRGYVNENYEYINSRIKPNSLLVQGIVSHIENPIEHIKITACIPNKEIDYIADNINQLTLIKNYSNKYLWCMLNSNLINWYSFRFIYGKAIRTMRFDNPITSRIPIKSLNLTEQQPFITLVDQILEGKKEGKDTTSLEKDIDKMVYDLYELTQEEIEIVEGRG